MKNVRLKKLVRTCFLMTCLLLNFVFILAQSGGSKQITGRVSDQKGELLAGVVVVEVGTTNGVITDENGTYTIMVKSGSPVLKFTCIGFKEKVVETGKNAIVDVALDEDVAFLDEVVVVGFGSQKKASVVGAISTIEPQSLLSAPARSISNNLAGKLAGVIAVQRTGNPWFNDSDFWIRGMSTFGNSKPLVLIDGIERSMHDMDPNEIESFSVLKDAAASAVYGVRGANGVVMITTKRGKIGAPKVTARFEQAFTRPTKIPKYIGSVPYLELMNELFLDANPLKPVPNSEAVLENYRNNTDPDLYPDINWWDVVAKDHASSTTANIDINGGSDILRYALTLGVYNESGIIERDRNQEWDSSLKVRRYNVRSNVDINLTKTTLFRFNIGGHLITRNSPPGWDETNFGIFYQASRVPPYRHPPIYSSGEIPRVEFRENPWAWATQRGYETLNRHKIESLASIEQDLKAITPGLSAKLSFSFDRYSGAYKVRGKNPDYYKEARYRNPDGSLNLEIDVNGQQFLGYDKGSEWGEQSIYMEGAVNYDRVFDGKHAVNSMLMYNQRELERGQEAWDRLPYRTQGIAGRFSYTYDTRYIAEFNFGYNGSENFAKGKRYGFFPSVSLGWIISQESFMQGISKTISNLKLRGSWGQVGNSILGRNIWDNRFAYLSTINDYGWYTLGTESNFFRVGKAEGNVENASLTWETSTKTNLGLEIGLLGNAINYTVDIFMDKRKDIFMQRTTVPGSAGFIQTPYANFGKVENKGIEMSLNINKKLSDDWYITAMANYTFARNKIIEKDEPEAVIGTSRAETGHPVNQLFGFIADGLFTEDDFDSSGNVKPGIPVYIGTTLRPGDIKYKDMNGDNVIDPKDRTAIGGTFNPEIVYGFGANIRYKAIDFGFFFQGVGNTYQLLGGENWLPGTAQGATGNIFSNYNDRWTKDNPRDDTFWPRLTYGPNINNEQASTWWLKDMSFLRLRTLEAGYSFPQKWLNTFGVENLRVFARGSNLLTFSKFKLWDPELDTTDGLKYPMTQSVSFGLSINFR
ncbi:TonB-dependent receptor [Prevotella sp. 10(H)]|uniref:SusC/RagA family TonB-linked outer membrane protein n=1 Tax=Prevotella sp. 10(H) TaxID=1158294 RepID=UPI0004A761B2|nr:TonB-dependent receptor [Prevotella sp. 10(H)]